MYVGMCRQTRQTSFPQERLTKTIVARNVSSNLRRGHHAFAHESSLLWWGQNINGTLIFPWQDMRRSNAASADPCTGSAESHQTRRRATKKQKQKKSSVKTSKCSLLFICKHKLFFSLLTFVRTRHNFFQLYGRNNCAGWKLNTE